MPLKLMVFVACERVLINREDNIASVIGIIQGFTLPSEPAPGNGLPMTWYAYAQLDRGGEPMSKFTYRAELKSPSGKVLAQASGAVSSENPDRRFHRLICKFVGFPIDGVGDYVLSMALDEQGRVEVAAQFPIPVHVDASKAGT